jgi:hypothetical protein
VNRNLDVLEPADRALRDADGLVCLRENLVGDVTQCRKLIASVYVTEDDKRSASVRVVTQRAPLTLEVNVNG